ncbi:MAG: hypothetical protein NZ602_11150 [Thermoguttaceae bacterium]|nr:hypothetical protein [Thermoguttaceae bacterium]MDW8037228.1 uroporphyrinogen decarboxylase family protein [Thermoguttaceae bacterium]
MGAWLSVDRFDFDRDEIERRKQLVRDLWAGRALDHMPVYVVVENPSPRWTVREQFLDAGKQWEEALTTAGLTWQHVPGGDMVPAVRPDVGCSCLATAFGAELYWGHDPNQTCWVKAPILKHVEEAFELEVPPPDAGLLAEGARRVAQFVEAGKGLISVSLLDMAGGLNVAMDLLGGEALYAAMYEHPEALKCLLGKIQQLFLSAIERQIEAAGGEDQITTTDFPETWFPEGYKGHVSDDISANISPILYEQFSRPYHDLVFQRYGPGGLHNCGPNPCLEAYLSHRPPPRSLDLSYPFSQRDLPRIKQVLRKRALVYMRDFPANPAEAIAAYENIVEQMAPDVIVIPLVTVALGHDPAELYRRLRILAEEYAKRMDWGWLDVDSVEPVSHV